MLPKYKKTTDVQQTWREHGWSPPSEDPDVRSRWAYFRTLDTERANDQERPLPTQIDSHHI
jgi:hypothetical protein